MRTAGVNLKCCNQVANKMGLVPTGNVLQTAVIALIKIP
jgi:hypothetical protein